MLYTEFVTAVMAIVYGKNTTITTTTSIDLDEAYRKGATVNETATAIMLVVGYPNAARQLLNSK
jgi:hypothetical protein